MERFKNQPLYQSALAAASPACPMPPTPDTQDISISKRDWEKVIIAWRKRLRVVEEAGAAAAEASVTLVSPRRPLAALESGGA